jgi:hypothetical protein
MKISNEHNADILLIDIPQLILFLIFNAGHYR